jgi:acyl carrier protein
MENTVGVNNETTEKLIQILKDMTNDWDIDLEGGIERNTKLMADLDCDSCCIVELIVTIEEAFNTRKIPFEKLLMVEGRYVDDLTVGEVADFIAAYV